MLTFLGLLQRRKTILLCHAKLLGHARVASLIFLLVPLVGRLSGVSVLPLMLTTAVAAPLRISMVSCIRTRLLGRHLAVHIGHAREIDIVKCSPNMRASARKTYLRLHLRSWERCSPRSRASLRFGNGWQTCTSRIVDILWHQFGHFGACTYVVDPAAGCMQFSMCPTTV